MTDKEQKKNSIHGWMLAGTFLLFFLLYLFQCRGNNSYIITFACKIVQIVCGILIVYILSVYATKLQSLKKFLGYIGSKSWYIYLLHSYFTCLAKVIMDICKVRCAILELILGVCMGTVFPIVIGIISKKMKVFDVLFYPQRYLLNKDKVK